MTPTFYDADAVTLTINGVEYPGGRVTMVQPPAREANAGVGRGRYGVVPRDALANSLRQSCCWCRGPLGEVLPLTHRILVLDFYRLVLADLEREAAGADHCFVDRAANATGTADVAQFVDEHGEVIAAFPARLFLASLSVLSGDNKAMSWPACECCAPAIKKVAAELREQAEKDTAEAALVRGARRRFVQGDHAVGLPRSLFHVINEVFCASEHVRAVSVEEGLGEVRLFVEGPLTAEELSRANEAALNVIPAFIALSIERQFSDEDAIALVFRQLAAGFAEVWWAMNSERGGRICTAQLLDDMIGPRYAWARGERGQSFDAGGWLAAVLAAWEGHTMDLGRLSLDVPWITSRAVARILLDEFEPTEVYTAERIAAIRSAYERAVARHRPPEGPWVGRRSARGR